MISFSAGDSRGGCVDGGYAMAHHWTDRNVAFTFTSTETRPENVTAVWILRVQ